MPAALLGLQQTIGNRLVQHLVAGAAPVRWAAQISPGLSVPAAPEPMQDGGKSGVGTLSGELVAATLRMPNLQTTVNEDGLLDGELISDLVPKVFVNRSKSGAARAHYAGGTGGAGDQPVGSITLVAPTTDTRAPPAAGGTAAAWVRAGTGTATVTRSFTGVLKGANGPDFYVTTRASLRTDRHERLHVASSRGHHNTHIRPLEARVAARTGERRALSSGATVAAASAALVTELGWNASVTAFQTADIADNTPGGTVDTTDSASADFTFDYGPRTVRGVAYGHYIDIPPGP